MHYTSTFCTLSVISHTDIFACIATAIVRSSSSGSPIISATWAKDDDISRLLR